MLKFWYNISFTWPQKHKTLTIPQFFKIVWYLFFNLFVHYASEFWWHELKACWHIYEKHPCLNWTGSNYSIDLKLKNPSMPQFHLSRLTPYYLWTYSLESHYIYPLPSWPYITFNMDAFHKSVNIMHLVYVTKI